MDTVIALLSGGLDSSTLVHSLSELYNVVAISFDYGQRHRKELDASIAIAGRLRIEHSIIDLTSVGEQFAYSTQSTLVNQELGAPPDGHYAEQTMKRTIVPNRNMIMLSIAAGIAVAREARYLAFAAHSGDHYIYPDCRPEFIDAFRATLRLAVDSVKPRLLSPFEKKSKAQIVTIGSALIIPVPWDITWSCYKGGDIHCGRCGTCVERQEAFFLAGIHDPTQYEDSEFWKQAVREHAEGTRG